MSDMPAPLHARSRLSPGQRNLAVAVVLLGVALMPMAFAEMLRTVVTLLAPLGFAGWAWTVPVGTEVGFIGLYLIDVLMEWKHRPVRALRAGPYAFAAASVWLNVAAAPSVPAMVGHAVLPMLFFGYLLAGKAAVKRLTVSDAEHAKAAAMADARRYALDLVRAMRGPFWRFRVPSLLRRQILSSRFPDEAREAVERTGSGGWQKDVRAWVLGPDGLNVKVQAKADSERARDAIRSAPEPAAPAAPEVPAETPPKVTPERASRGDRSALQEVGRIAKREGARKVPRDLLLEAIRDMYSGDTPPTPYRVAKELPVGEKTAKELLAEVTSEGADVIQMAR